jgi:hypothetical protein
VAPASTATCRTTPTSSTCSHEHLTR